MAGPKKKIVIFGAGGTGMKVYEKYKYVHDVLYATDNAEGKIGGLLSNELPIYDKKELLLGGYDFIYIASLTGVDDIYRQLVNDMGIPSEKIIRIESDHSITARSSFLTSLAALVYDKGIEGDVAEAGVFRGDFSKVINGCFPDRNCYLFDTFEGFDNRDIDDSVHKNESYQYTNVELVLAKLPHKEKCFIRKGYFPDTFDMFANSFCFVNLDLDLYNPIKAGLELFYPRLVPGGIVLVHDFFNPYYPGVKKAVEEFCTTQNIVAFPIGDGISVGIQKGTPQK